jgi:hypothetical protein
MTRFSVHRSSPAMGVALVALGVALGGTAVAASQRVNGDNLIKKASLSGNRLRPATITAKQLNFKKLGVVPSATEAQTAHSAMTAISATSATNATRAASAGALAQIAYRSAVFQIRANLARATGMAACPSGTFAVGGGVASPSEATAANDFLVDSYPTANRTGWQATVENDGASPLNETVWAVCVAASATG